MGFFSLFVFFFLSPHPVSDFSEVVQVLCLEFYFSQSHNQSRICFCAACLLLLILII